MKGLWWLLLGRHVDKKKKESYALLRHKKMTEHANSGNLMVLCKLSYGKASIC